MDMVGKSVGETLYTLSRSSILRNYDSFFSSQINIIWYHTYMVPFLGSYDSGTDPWAQTDR
jgi:hypothetical protein